jgi:hypothetical protein
MNFTVEAYNAVGDVQTGRIRRQSKQELQLTGPIDPSDEYNVNAWETVWYNSTIKCIKLKKVKVEYIDGSKYTYVNELPTILAESFSNSCKM